NHIEMSGAKRVETVYLQNKAFTSPNIFLSSSNERSRFNNSEVASYDHGIHPMLNALSMEKALIQSVQVLSPTKAQWTRKSPEESNITFRLIRIQGITSSTSTQLGIDNRSSGYLVNNFTFSCPSKCMRRSCAG
ncbi:25410_t:CDS:2, partial [Dentiscutata erythropus]